MNVSRSRLWFWLAFGVVCLVGLLTRFYGLAAKPLHHDESLFAYYAYLLSAGDGYVYQPILHGAVLQNVNAFFFVLLGADKFTMRLPVALGALAMLPLVYFWGRRYLGQWGLLAALAAVVLSPSLCFYGRFLRNDVPFMVVTCWCALCVLRAMQTHEGRYWFWGICAAVLSFSMMESSIFFFACCAAYLGVVSFADCCSGRKMSLARGRQLVSGEVVYPFGNGDFDEKKYRELRRGLLSESLSVGWLAGGALVMVCWFLWAGAMDALARGVAGLLGQWSLWFVPFGAWVALGAACSGVWFWVRSQMLRPTGRMGVVWDFGWNVRRNWAVITAAVLLGVAFYQTLFTTWFTHVRGEDFNGEPVVLHALQIYKNTWDYWWDQHLQHRIKGPFHYHLPILFMYELPILLLIGFSWWRNLLRDRSGVRHALWLVVPQVALLVLGSVAQAAGLVNWATLDRLLHVTCQAHLQLALFYVQMLVYFVPAMFLRRRFVESFLVFWFVTMIFAYSYAGEKVPWLAVHVAGPGCLLFGYYVQQFVVSVRWTVVHRLWWGVAIALCALAVVCQARALWFVCFVHPHSPVERLVYNHTHPEVEIAVEGLHKLAHDSLLGSKFPYFMEGEVAWPLYWYLRDMPNVPLQEGETLANTARPVVIVDWYEAVASENIARNYDVRRFKVREWWEPPMLSFSKMAGIWRVAVPAARLQTQGALRLAAARTEWQKLWHYLLWRKIWLDTVDREFSNSANEFAYCVRRDFFEKYLSNEALVKRTVRRELPTYPPRNESPVTEEMLKLREEPAAEEPTEEPRVVFSTELEAATSAALLRLKDDMLTTSAE